MKQYCRYCTYLVTGNGIYCEAKNKTLSESAAKHTNKCKLFELNEIDAFFETKGYKPRESKEATANGYEQITMEE